MRLEIRTYSLFWKQNTFYSYFRVKFLEISKFIIVENDFSKSIQTRNNVF